MKKNTYGAIASFSGAVLLLLTQASLTSAQVRGRSSDDFFQRGNQRLEQEVKNLQNPSPDLEIKTEVNRLHNELNRQQAQPCKPKGTETTAPDQQYNNNVPGSPDDEVEVKF